MSDKVGHPSSPTAHVTVAVLVTLIVSIVVGASVAKTEIVARGLGRAVPASRVQLVQPQVAGRIASIEVAPGDAVEEGQPLVRLVTTDAEARREALRGELAREERRVAAARAALAALGADPAAAAERAAAAFDRAVPGARDALQRELMLAEMAELADGLRALDAEAERVARGVEALEAQADALRAQEELASLRLARAASLRDRGAGTQAALEEAESAERSMTRQIAAAERGVDERRAELAAVAVERERLAAAARRRQAELLEGAEAERARLAQEVRTAEQDLADRVIRAPRSGRVADMAVFTVGGRVAEGERLMTVVPLAERLLIEAAISNRDVGFVETGQTAQVKLDAFPFERYGAVDGRVAAVASDARRDEATGGWVYPIELELADPFVLAAGRRLPIQPGMTVTVDIAVGERRYISFVFEPVIRAVSESFTEQ